MKLGDVIPEPGEVFSDEEGNKTTVLPDESDPNYNPSEDELEEYAEYIGIDVKEEKELLWIALEGLRTPLPPEWRACKTEEDEVYYFNFYTGESLWDHPSDEAFKQKVVQEREKLGKSRTNTSSTGSPHPIGKEKNKNDGTSSGYGPGSSNNNNHPSAIPSAKREGITKSITASLLGNGTASAGLSGGSGGAGPGKTVRLCSLDGSGHQDGGGNTSHRGAPDVSDLLPSNSLLSTGKPLGSRSFGGSASVLSHVYPGMSLPSHTAALPPKGLDTASIFSNSIEFEKNMRQRLRSELEVAAKAQRAEKDRQFLAEKNNLDLVLQKHQETLANEWKKEQEQVLKNNSTQCSRESAEIVLNWERKIKILRETIKERENAIEEEKKMPIEKRRNSTTLENLKSELNKQREKKVSERRQELMTQTVDQALKKEKDRHEKNLDNILQRSNSFLDETRKKREAEKIHALAEVESKGKTDVGNLMKEISSLMEKHAELKHQSDSLLKQEEESQEAKKRSARALKEKKSIAREAALEKEKEAHRKADEELKELDVELDAKINVLEETHKVKQRRLTQQLEEIRQATDSIRHQILELGAKKEDEMALASQRGGNDNGKEHDSLSSSIASERIRRLEEENKLEDKKCREEMENHLEAFKAITEQLVKTKEHDTFSREQQEAASREQKKTKVRRNRAKGDGDISAHQKYVGSSLIEKIKQKHLQNLKQLEALHEKRVGKLRDDHHQLLTSANRSNIRRSPMFSKLLNERKKAWIATHPTPLYHVDDIPSRAQMEEDEWKALSPITSAEVQAAVEEAIREGKKYPPVPSPLPTGSAAESHTRVEGAGSRGSGHQTGEDPLNERQEGSRRTDRLREQKWKEVVEKVCSAPLELIREEAQGKTLSPEKVERICAEYTSFLRSRLEFLTSRLSSVQECQIPYTSCLPSAARPEKEGGRGGREEWRRACSIPVESHHAHYAEKNSNNRISRSSSSSSNNNKRNHSFSLLNAFILATEAEQQVTDLRSYYEQLLSPYRETLLRKQEQLRKMIEGPMPALSAALGEPSRTDRSFILTPPASLTSQRRLGFATHCPPPYPIPVEGRRTTAVPPRSAPQSRMLSSSKERTCSGCSSYRLSTPKGAYRDLPFPPPFNSMVMASNTPAHPAPSTHCPAGLPSLPLNHPYFFQCLHGARDRLHAQKKALKENQQYLKMVREDWRNEMILAKQQDNKPAIHYLRSSRLQLENYARRLNTAVLAVKLEREQLDDFCRDLLRAGREANHLEHDVPIYKELPPTSYIPPYEGPTRAVGGMESFSKQYSSHQTMPLEQQLCFPFPVMKEHEAELEHRQSRNNKIKGHRSKTVKRSKSGKKAIGEQCGLEQQANNLSSLSLRMEPAKSGPLNLEVISSQYALPASEEPFLFIKDRRDVKKTEKKRRKKELTGKRSLNNHVEQWLEQQRSQ